MLGECGMLERDKRGLRKYAVTLCKEMVVDELFVQSLQTDDILTDSMAEGILVCCVQLCSSILLPGQVTYDTYQLPKNACIHGPNVLLLIYVINFNHVIKCEC